MARGPTLGVCDRIESLRMRMQDKHVLITGGARRIGRAIALEMAREGAGVAITYRKSKAEAEAVVAEMKALGAAAMAVECELKSQESARNAVDAVVREFRGIDVLVNNAGVFRSADFEQITIEEWDEVFDANVRGPFLMSQAAMYELRKSRGRIVNLGSLGGMRAWATHAHYCSSKAALHMLTQSMAKAVAPEVMVNCVAPGMIEFEGDHVAKFAQKTPMGRNGSAADVVGAVMYFAALAEFVTGQVLAVDGGLGL